MKQNAQQDLGGSGPCSGTGWGESYEVFVPAVKLVDKDGGEWINRLSLEMFDDQDKAKAAAQKILEVMLGMPEHGVPYDPEAAVPKYGVSYLPAAFRMTARQRVG